VPEHSAIVFGARDTDNVALPGDHCTIVKPIHKGDQNFVQIASRIKSSINRAPYSTQQKWRIWENEKGMTFNGKNVGQLMTYRSGW
jgi:hypothetical protein